MTTAAGIATTTVSTAQLAPLGFELTVPAASGADTGAGNGPQVWVYVYNDSGTWAQGHVITMDVSETSGAHQRFHGALAPALEEGTPSSSVLGVAQHAIALASYGFILKKGVGEVLAGAGTIQEQSVTGAGSICCDDASDALGEAMGSAGLAATGEKYNCTIGFSLENAAVADGALATCYIDIGV